MPLNLGRPTNRVLLILRIVALLRQANYDFATIRTTLDELEAGQSRRVVAAVEQRRSELASMSWRCLEAMAAFYAYISEFLDGQTVFSVEAADRYALPVAESMQYDC